MKGLLAVLLLLGAGCLSPPSKSPPPKEETPVALLFCPREGLCNFEMTPDKDRQGNEVTIAVNPKDPHNIVGGAKDYYPEDAGECVWDGVYVTLDGFTYDDRSFDGSPWRQIRSPDPSKINYATQFWCTTDPVVTFDRNGRLYYLLMAYQADPVTASKTGEGVLPMGGLNDFAFNRAVQIVAISDDGGRTFKTLSPVLEGSYPVAFHDKGWIAVGGDGTIHVGWLASTEGNLYFRSTDGGRSWSDPKVIAFSFGGGALGVEAGQGTMIAVGPHKEVYYSWLSPQGIALSRSLDGGAHWETSKVVVVPTPTKMENGLSPRDRRDDGFPFLAVDSSPNSPFSGGIYLVWQDGRNNDSDIYFTASYDGGMTFSTPVRVDDGPPGTFQFYPALSVSPGGVVDVTWLDTRNDPQKVRIDQYYSYSLDGGKTWSRSIRVRDAHDQGWDPHLSHHQNGMIFIGDYIGIASSWLAAHPIWPDTRSNTGVDVFTATVLRPIFAVGWDPSLQSKEMEKACALHPEADFSPWCRI